MTDNYRHGHEKIVLHVGYCECDSMNDVSNRRIETGNSMLDRVLGPEPDGYLVPKILESPSTS